MKNTICLRGLLERKEGKVKNWRQYTVDTLQDLNLSAKKSKGQNFLIRYRVANQMVKFAEITPQDHVLEIGGGLGILTDALIQTGATVTVIEKEEKLAKHLTSTYENYDRVHIIHDDALLYDWPKQVDIVSNLPYFISTPLLEKIQHHSSQKATVMLQREVGLRCLAKPGSKNYSRLSVLCQIHSTAKRVMDVSPNSFLPRPKVSSIVLSFWSKEISFRNHHEEIELLARNLFSLRRRIVRSVIRGFLKRNNAPSTVWDNCPYKTRRIYSLSAIEIDEILDHLKKNNSWPLA